MFATPQFPPSAEPALLLSVVRFRLETHDFSLCFLSEGLRGRAPVRTGGRPFRFGPCVVDPSQLITTAHRSYPRRSNGGRRAAVHSVGSLLRNDFTRWIDADTIPRKTIRTLRETIRISRRANTAILTRGSPAARDTPAGSSVMNNQVVGRGKLS